MVMMINNKNKLSIIAVAILAAGGIMVETAMNVTFPELTAIFHTSLNNIQWITTAYLLAVTVTMTISAYLTKKFGVRLMWILANLLFVIGSLFAGLATNLGILLLGRVLEGISAGIAMPLMFNLILMLIPRHKIGVWMGIGSMVISLAPSFGPSYGGALISSLGWRSIFITLLIIPVVSLCLGWFTIPKQTANHQTPSFDLIAFILLSIALISGILTINQFESGMINPVTLSITAITLLLFIYRSLRSEKTFLNIRLFKLKSFTLLLIPVTLYMFANLGLGLLIPNYLQTIHHTSSLLAGFSLLPGTLVGAFLSPLFGSLYDKIGPKKLLITGNSIFTLSVLFMYFVTNNLNLLMVILSYTIFTIGRSMAFSTGMTAAIADVQINDQNDANAILQASQMFMGAAGTTVAALFGSWKIEQGMRNFLLMIIMIAMIIFIMFFLQQKKSRIA
ncbi:multidrug efflux MFS transporter [Leuconostoc pseudomesenteroides]|uniref:Multidrug efflux MFS transporter n=3 Tax=Leuconostoc pseudomesenteroides TaxID=33968 RepID=A0A5B8SZS9_LEUPS|nr:MFS transporter [Leuconostoc pseudomesenteroides]MCT4381477.1 MFS transporter [Leuconostoc pseudomesenteroides]QEA42409.1 multidrug efflux MFS transporter [Leuconostoc pseudomesenteroides]